MPRDTVVLSFFGGFLGVVTGLFLAACAYVLYRGLDRLHEAIECRREERSADRPPQDDLDGPIAVAMAGWCCTAWAATAGADHDPECRHYRRSSAT